MYIAHPSLVEDLKIMLATVKILFMPESTEGIAEGATTAMGAENSEKGNGLMTCLGKGMLLPAWREA